MKVCKINFVISRICSEEGDISNYVWSENSADLPEQVGWTSAATRSVAQAGGECVRLLSC